MAVKITLAQIKVEGAVRDSIGNPLELANVIAINQDTKALDSYGITNDKGRYKLNLKPDNSYMLRVSYIGKRTHEALLTTTADDLVRDFNLENDSTLEAVQLTYEMPVTIKGDTLVYNADSFTRETDRKLEDVLKRLPGVEVNDEGQIEVEGKPVEKVMVEGKDFFDGDTKLATKNIPSNAIDKVQVLKNYDEVSQLRNLRSNEDNIAINIKLKEGKKRFWFGEVTAGMGFEERYMANPRLFYYSPEYSINLIADLNNIGNVPFTMQDYFNFTGGFRGVSRSSGTEFNVASGDMGFLTMQNNRARAIDTKFGAANFSFSPKKGWDLSGFAIYSGTRTDIRQESTRRYVESGEGSPMPPEETTSNDTHQKTDLGIFKLSSSYRPNSNNHFDYDIFGRVSNQNEFSDFFSSISSDIDEVQRQNPVSINQNLNYYYTLNDKNIFAFEGQYLWQDEDPFYNARLKQNEQFRLDGILGLDPNQSLFDLVQNKRVRTNRLDAKLDYWYVLNNKSNINFTFGTLFSSQKFSSDIFQILDSGDSFDLEDAQFEVDNDIRYNLSDAYFGFHYRLKTGMFTIAPGFSIHSYKTENKQFGSSFDIDFFRLVPDFSLRLQLKKSENLNFRYQMQTSFTDVNQLAEGAVLNNFDALYRGNRRLESALSHNLNLSYFNFNMFNYTNIHGVLNYNKRIDPIRSRTEFLNIPNTEPGGPDAQTTNRIRSPYNSHFADESFSGSAQFERMFGKIKATVGGSFNYSKFYQEVNDLPSLNTSFSRSLRTRMSTNFRDAPNLEIGYNLSVNTYELGGGRSKFFTHSPFINFDAYLFERLTLNADYTFYNYRNEAKTLNQYGFMNAGLAYQKKDSKWEYSIGVTNILNTTSLNQDDTNLLYASTSEYYVQPRFFVFSLTYDF
jgi:hypothetical protein